MKDLHLAIALTLASSKHGISHRDRKALLGQAGSLQGILPYLKESRENLLYQAMTSELRGLEKRSFPDTWKAVTYLDSLYPRRLLQISRPPALLFMSGDHLPALNQAFVVGIIGSRKPSSYGVEVTRKLAGEIADRGIPIISGGARGIDGLAHARALERGGLTLAVTGSGLGSAYPPEHRTLFDRIEKQGGLITEFVPGTLPKPNHFPARNRILAGLCDAILITEASHASGTLITAGFAADYGREVMAVPGSILSGASRSCHALIRDGASLIESVDDIPGIPGPYQMNQPNDQDQGSKACHLAVEDEAILEALGHAARTLEALVQCTGYAREKLALRLAILQNRGLVSLHRGLYCRAIRDQI